jgi:hypothetical protein
MEEEFYATIKLVSGEEVFSKVCPCDEQDRIILILDNPVIMEHIPIPSIRHSMISVNPWIKNSSEDIYLIDIDKIITITEVKDKELLKVYKRYLKTKDKSSGRIEVTPNMGFISSIDDARESLEKLYESK